MFVFLSFLFRTRLERICGAVLFGGYILVLVLGLGRVRGHVEVMLLSLVAVFVSCVGVFVLSG